MPRDASLTVAGVAPTLHLDVDTEAPPESGVRARPSRGEARRARVEARDRTDAELLEQVARGDRSALGELYDRHARGVWRVIARVTRGSRDVEDLVHATFLKMPSIAAAFDGRDPSCGPWIRGVAVRVALHHQRGARRLALTMERFARAAMGRTSEDPEAHAGRVEAVARVERALAAMGPKKRAVFVLVEVEGLATEDVAEHLGIPPATVRTRLFAAKSALRAALGDIEA